MTDAAALELRHVRLAEPVTLRPAPLGPTPGGAGEGAVEEGVFVALDDSPPVRTVVAVVEGGRRRALEVAWVVEVAEQGDAGGSSTRGFYGRWVGDEALERAAKVGTEHLEDGTPVVQPVVHDNSSVLDVSDTAMAMPAPVMVLGSDDDDDDEDDEREASDEAGEAREGETGEAREGETGEAREGEAGEAREGEATDAGREAMQAIVAEVVRTSSEVADTAEHAETISYPENVYTAQTITYPEYAVGEPPEDSAGAEATPDAEAAESGPDTLHYGDYRHEGAVAGEGAEQAASESASGSYEQGEADEAEATEASTDSGEVPSESGEPGESRSKGRKKRKRRK
jgi:hypothetical protein